MSPGYKAIRQAAAWLDVSDRGAIVVRGEDRIRLLHALASNAIEPLRAGEGAETFFLNPQGRIQAFARVYVLEDCVLLDCDAGRRRVLFDYVGNYIIMDDVELEDVTDSRVAIAVEGPEAAERTARAAGIELTGQPAHRHQQQGGSRAFGSSLTGGPGVWLSSTPERRDELIGRLEGEGVIPATEEDFHTVRVELGMPLIGRDYFETNIPHETGLLHAVSFTKGCYVGQEIVERVETQGQVQRRLCRIEVDARTPPETRRVAYEGREQGELTSAVYSPSRQAVLGFAMLRREAWAPGTALTVGGLSGRVIE